MPVLRAQAGGDKPEKSPEEKGLQRAEPAGATMVSPWDSFGAAGFPSFGRMGQVGVGRERGSWCGSAVCAWSVLGQGTALLWPGHGVERACCRRLPDPRQSTQPQVADPPPPPLGAHTLL